jgi:hypothetical protein
LEETLPTKPEHELASPRILSLRWSSVDASRYNARMTIRSFRTLALLLLTLTTAAHGQEPPRIFESDGHALAAVKARLRAGDASLAPALAKLREQADKDLKAGPFTVTQKKHPIPNGDPHDYVSLAP